MDLKIKVGKIGFLDMMKFKNQPKFRLKAINNAPAKDIKADYPINRNAKLLHPDFQTLKVVDVIEHKEADSKTYVFESADNKPLAYFRAGQYLSLKLQIGESFVTRPYSISSSPKWATDGKVAITVRKTASGFASDWILENLKAGDTVISSAPEGNFYYEFLRDTENVVAVAGGSGITPFLSMAYAIRDGIEDFNLTILFGSKTESSILFKDELEKISAECSKVKVVHVLSDEKKDGYENGFITADIIKKYAPEEYSIFLCGPEMMYRFVGKEIEKLNIPNRLVRREMLGVTKNVSEMAGYPSECKDKEFTIKLNQTDKTYTIKALSSEPILSAIERAGIKAPSKCRSGECGWCRSKLLSGDVFIPEENEYRRRADVTSSYIHPCCTFPLSDIEMEIPSEYF